MDGPALARRRRALLDREACLAPTGLTGTDIVPRPEATARHGRVAGIWQRSGSAAGTEALTLDSFWDAPETKTLDPGDSRAVTGFRGRAEAVHEPAMSGSTNSAPNAGFQGLENKEADVDIDCALQRR